ncbi:helix-turn-helix domain-containing protein [Solicola gregarius]|uniref:AraC family transcriptional regulator n=1 Tax=Solicola gregarius TaxID=2908642 RepID=A0AA46TLS5_9ACTN|nr:helix-turn-helix domain-containing protein [Solicola gregarius]UYM07279.1 AraC family transcriptional regulator [Solicola gregarius]
MQGSQSAATAALAARPSQPERMTQPGLEVEHRPSESPYIERVWRSRSHGDVAQMLSVATPRVGLVFWRQQGEVGVAVTGPESMASPAPLPAEATFFGVEFPVGTYLPHLPSGRQLLDRQITIPDVSDRSFYLAGSHWQHPGFDTAEAFVRRLAREEIVRRDRLVADVARGATPDVSGRTVQRRFLAATGVTRGSARQMDRARHAAILLRDGVPSAEVLTTLGFYDNPHLHRSLRRFIGRTAAELQTGEREPLSLLYMT